MILGKLTREFILERVSQVTIFAYYLGIPESTITDCLANSKLICSPIRTDKEPTVGFYYTHDNRVRMNDFAGYFHGDCFDLVGYMKYLDAEDSVDFSKIKEIIAKDFQIHYYAPEYTGNPVLKRAADNFTKIVTNPNKKHFKDIQIPLLRNWTYVDEKFWTKSYRVTQAQLEYFNVYLPYEVYINKKLIYSFDERDPCYAYYLGTVKTELGVRNAIKLYFPYRKEYKFITNTRRMQGLHQLKEARQGLITKALKDVICIRRFNIQSAAVAGETIVPYESEMSFINGKIHELYSLMDFDYAGITMAQKLKRQYGVKPLFLTDGSRNTLDFQAKDFSDLVEVTDDSIIKDMLAILKDSNYQVNNEFIDYFQKYLT